MIAEAFDTAVTLGLALLAWIALTAATVTLALISLCVAVVWVCEGVWRGVAAASAAMAPRKPVTAPLAPELPPGGSQSVKTPERRTAAHVPTWAQPDTKEAA